jgi:hypothetical protein
MQAVAAVATQAAVVDTKAVAADTKAVAAAAGTKLLLLHWAAVCTTNGGANQLRRFAFAVAFQVASCSDRQIEGGLLRGIQRLRIGKMGFAKINSGLISFGPIGSDLIGFRLSAAYSSAASPARPVANESAQVRLGDWFQCFWLQCFGSRHGCAQACAIAQGQSAPWGPRSAPFD